MEHASDVAYRLKGYVYFSAVDDGVYFQGREGAFVLKGTNIYPFVAKVIGLMDAGHRHADISAKLPPKLKPFYDNMIAQLLSNNMLMDSQLLATVKAQYQAYPDFEGLLNYLQDHLGDFSAQFENWRNTTVRLVGEGYSLKAAVEALISSGLPSIEVVYHKVNDTNCKLSEIEQLLVQAKSQLSDFSFSFVHYDAASFSQTDTDFSIYCYHQIDQQLVLDLAESLDSPYCVAGLLQGKALVSPLKLPQQAGFFDMVQQINVEYDASEDANSPVAIAMLGSIAALNLIKHHFGIEAHMLTNYAFGISPHLDIARYAVLPVYELNQQSQAAIDFEAEQELPEDRELELYERLKMALAPLFNGLFGCFDQSLSRTIKQVPLFHEGLTVSYARQFNRQPQQLISWGSDASSAGCRALAHGLSLRASLLTSVSTHLLVTAFDYDSWRAKAAAVALINDARFVDVAQSMVVTLLGIDDDEIQLLTRFLNLYLDDDYQIYLYWHPQHAVYLARLKAGNGLLASAIDYKPLDAIREVMGAAYCLHHFADMPNSLHPHDEPQLPAPSLVDNGEQLRGLLVREVEPMNVIEKPIDLRIAAHLVYSGYVELADSEA